MVRNMSRYLLKSAINAWRNLKADNMSIVCVGVRGIWLYSFDCLILAPRFEQQRHGLQTL
jgi:hypothetical protein